MPRLPRSGWLCLLLGLALLGDRLQADTVTLKTGVVYRGAVDKENTIVTIFDGVKRTVLRDTKVSSIQSEERARDESFLVDQPLITHTGVMPEVVFAVRAELWDNLGRRAFSFMNERARTQRFTQAINELGPQVTRIRGIDGFWQGQLTTGQIPRPVVLGLLDQVDQQDQAQRLKVGRFLIQAQWYPEAIGELDRLETDFPDLAATIEAVRGTVRELQAQETLRRIDRLQRAGQPRAVRTLLTGFPQQGLSPEIAGEVAARLRADRERDQDDMALARAVRQVFDSLPSETQNRLLTPTLAMLTDLSEAPDAVRDRFPPFAAASGSEQSPEARLALALSGWLLGPEAASPGLDGAERLWEARQALQRYLVGNESDRLMALDRLRTLLNEPAGDASAVSAALPDQLQESPTVPDEAMGVSEDAASDFSGSTPTASSPESPGDSTVPDQVPDEPAPAAAPQPEPPPQRLTGPAAVLDRLARLIRHAGPPLASAQDSTPGALLRLRALDDDNPEPTEYVAILPPEYQPARSYPVLISLHAGNGPESAARYWSEEAAEHGYIVIAPEYNVPGQPPDYRYSESEHAAVTLALRDARKRFGVDSNRVFLAGVLHGGNMAWDYGLAHPDLFAGVAIVSGLPAKYVWSYRNHADLVPLYIAMGDLAPAEPDLIFPLGTSLISRNYDVIYVEYYKRGLEDLPEERPRILEWMDCRRRDPYPREFTVSSARSSDDRFYGMVLREFNPPERARPPEQVDNLGKNLSPATITRSERTLANLLDVRASGVSQIDLWMGPPHLDLTDRFEIRVNGNTSFRGRIELDIARMLDDFRIRGDREQLYWARYTATVGRSRR